MTGKHKIIFTASFITILILLFSFLYFTNNTHYGYRECLKDYMHRTKTNVAAARVRTACKDFDKYDVEELKLEAKCIVENMIIAQNDVAAATLANACVDEFGYYKKYLP